MNAFKQLHLNIKSNLPPPFGTGAFAEPDELYLCAGGEGKGAGEPSGLTWEHAGMRWCMRLTCASLAPVLSMVVLDLAGRTLTTGQLARQGVEWPVHACGRRV